MNAEEILLRLIAVFTLNLEELASLSEKTQFVEGQITAYVDGLENLQLWENANSAGLDYNVASKFLS